MGDKYELCTLAAQSPQTSGAPQQTGSCLYWLSLSSTDLSSNVCALPPVFPRMRLVASCLLLIFESSLTRGSVPVPDGDGTNTCPEGWVDSSLVNMGTWELHRTPGTEQAIYARASMEHLLRLRTRCRWNFFKCNFNFLRAPMQQDPFGQVDGRTMIMSRT